MKIQYKKYAKTICMFFTVLSLVTFAVSANCYANYSKAIELFESSQFSKAKSFLSAYAKSGATIGYAYLKHMDEAYTHPYPEMPEAWLDESNNALQASLAYMIILNKNRQPNSKARAQKTSPEEKNAALKNLMALIMKQKCSRAAVLLGKLIENHSQSILKLSFYKILQMQKIDSSATFYPWAFKQLPPAKALSDLDLLCVARFYIFTPRTTIDTLRINFPTYAEYWSEVMGVNKVNNFNPFILKVQRDKNTPSKISETFKNAALPFTTMIDFQNGTRAAATTLYVLRRHVFGDLDQIDAYCYHVCKTLPDNEFRQPMYSYEVCLGTSKREPLFEKMYTILSNMIDSITCNHSAIYFNYANALRFAPKRDSDLKKAHHYYLKSFELEDMNKVRIRLAEDISQGIGCEANQQQALELLNADCIDHSNPDIIYLQGIILYRIHGRCTEVANYFLRAHKAGFNGNDAILSYAEHHVLDNKNHIISNPAKLKVALDSYKECANIEAFDDRNKILFASCCVQVGNAQDYEKGIRILETLHKQRNDLASIELFNAKQQCVRSKKDAELVLQISKKCKKLEDDCLINSIFYYLRFGLGSKENCIQNIKRIADKSQFDKNLMYYFSEVAYSAINESKIDLFLPYKELFEKAAKEGNPNALIVLIKLSSLITNVPNYDDSHIESAKFPDIEASSDDEMHSPRSNISNDDNADAFGNTDETQDIMSNDNAIALPKEGPSLEFPEVDFSDEEQDIPGNVDSDTDDEDQYDAATAADIKAAKQRWAQDRVNKHNVRFKKYDANHIPNLNLNKRKASKYTPRADHIEFLLCLFGEGQKRIYHFTHTQAQQAFATMGCKTWIKGNSFFIRAEDDLGNTHTFSSHIPHGKSMNLYSPTNKYLQRFCESIGVTLEAIKAAQK